LPNPNPTIADASLTAAQTHASADSSSDIPAPNQMTPGQMEEIVQEANAILDSVESSQNKLPPIAQESPAPPKVTGKLRAGLEQTLSVHSRKSQIPQSEPPPKAAVAETVKLSLALDDAQGQRIHDRWTLHDQISAAIDRKEYSKIIELAKSAVKQGIIPSLEELDQKGVLLDSFLVRILKLTDTGTLTW